MFSLLICLLVTLCLGQRTYEDYTVVRFYEMNEEVVQSFYEDDSLDVWQTNKIEGWADVMMHQDQLDKYLHLYPHKVILDNVQTELNRSAEENEKATAAAAGKPVAFDHFPVYSEVSNFVDQMVSAYPALASRVSLGNSYQGTNIFGINLGTSSNPNAPLFYIHCTIHAREWITTTTCCYIIEQLLTVDTNLLQYFNWVIVPIFNVDGYAYSHSSDRLWRKNRQPNSGSSCAGTDLNRNYGQGYGGPGSSNSPCSETYRGTQAWSGPEVQRERAYFNSWGAKAASVDIHSYGGYFLSPWGYTTTNPPDFSRMNELMVLGVNAIRGVNGRVYTHGSTSRTLYLASGGSSDWSYGESGVIPSYTIECYGSSFTPPVSWITPIATEVWAGVKALANEIGK
jgi:murein tripeptide amidase MpaA